MLGHHGRLALRKYNSWRWFDKTKSNHRFFFSRKSRVKTCLFKVEIDSYENKTPKEKNKTPIQSQRNGERKNPFGVSFLRNGDSLSCFARSRNAETCFVALFRETLPANSAISAVQSHFRRTAVCTYVSFGQIEECVLVKIKFFSAVEITEKSKGKTYISAFKKPYNR